MGPSWVVAVYRLLVPSLCQAMEGQEDLEDHASGRSNDYSDVHDCFHDSATTAWALAQSLFLDYSLAAKLREMYRLLKDTNFVMMATAVAY